jgi:1-acyl-sn-glycerol-3-phosphate acyltransferase
VINKKTLLIYAWAPLANLLWYFYTVVMATISLVLSPFDSSGAMQHWCARWWCRLIAWTIGARITVRGAENLEPARTYVYMANHCSLVDIPAMFAYLPYQFRIMAKKELFYVPFMGWHLWTAGNFPVDRGDPRKTARSLRSVVEGVRSGKSLAVFPEGTRSPDGKLHELKPGAFKIAIRAGVPIVPVAIRGTHDILPKHSLVPRPGVVEVVIGKPIDTQGLEGQSLRDLMEQVYQAIQRGLRDTGGSGGIERSRKQNIERSMPEPADGLKSMDRGV